MLSLKHINRVSSLIWKNTTQNINRGVFSRALLQQQGKTGTEQLMHSNEHGLHTTKQSYPLLQSSDLMQKLHEKQYSTSPLEKKEEEDSGKPLSQRQKLSKVFAQYGTAAVVFHTGISLTSLGICYAGVSSGIDMVALLEKLNIMSGDTMQASIAGGASTFVVAYAVHKVFMPVRIFLTVTCTPLLVRKLRDIGIMKSAKIGQKSGTQ